MRIEERKPNWFAARLAYRAKRREGASDHGRTWQQACELCGRCRGRRQAAAVNDVEYATAYQPK